MLPGRRESEPETALGGEAEGPVPSFFREDDKGIGMEVEEDSG